MIPVLRFFIWLAVGCLAVCWGKGFVMEVDAGSERTVLISQYRALLNARTELESLIEKLQEDIDKSWDFVSSLSGSKIMDFYPEEE